ncbi:rCG24991, isoform CRA_a [Rattus norvegicus]|uniref:RCG24991, isoform CRA_a n=1 Tax=Rattus norvegicus TaxID=10116 RepID=A6KFH2_RAT|nr:rCG24991, isoform CRA_a [Rattus norvegicus]EDL75256.1 rCG24991, isoform CRA_a [Rattus norvegicus]
MNRPSQLPQRQDQKVALVSRSAYFSQKPALTQGVGGKGFGESGTRWGLINCKNQTPWP